MKIKIDKQTQIKIKDLKAIIKLNRVKEDGMFKIIVNDLGIKTEEDKNILFDYVYNSLDICNNHKII